MQHSKKNIFRSFRALFEKLFTKQDPYSNPKKTLSNSPLFDAEYYSQQYPEVAQSEQSPIEHFIHTGAQKTYHPSQAFSSTFYQIANPEYHLRGDNPLLHYLSEGHQYGALTCPVLGSYSRSKAPLTLSPHSNTTNNNTITKVGFFSHNLNLEGAPLVCRDIAIAMQQTAAISAVVFSPSDGALREHLEHAGVEVIIHPAFDKNQIDSNAAFDQFIKRFASQISKHHFDRLYGNTILSFWVMHLAKQLNIPSVFHIHESEPINYHVQSKTFDFVPHIIDALALAQSVIFVADNTLEKYRAYQQHDNFQVIKNAFDTQTIPAPSQSARSLRTTLGIAEHERLFLNVGTVANRKGQIDLINALEKLSHATSSHTNNWDDKALGDNHYVMVGDIATAYSDYLHQRVEQLPQALAARIHFIKKTPQVFDYYNAADVGLFTSRIESYPKCIQEAMAFKLPIITTAVDGISEQLEDNLSALFYPAGDAEALAKQIQRISQDNALRKKLGTAAYKKLQTMISPEAMMQAHQQNFQTTDDT